MSWNFGDNSSLNYVDYDPEYTYSDTGIFEIKLIVFNSYSCSDTSYQLVEILPVDDIFVPSAFSPNGDGFNDVMYVRGRKIKEVKFVIYNRWGEKVFETTDKNIGWNGRHRGEKAQSSVYVYYVEAEVEDVGRVEQKGNITLVR